ncbi:MAG: galactokinase [Lentisphaeria bacterium]|nr:galactokinase [Lentisphaeria bacterium]MBO5899711.1 galactokinase [Lentisphaeria bacterium]
MKSFIDKFTAFYGSAPTAAAMAPGRLEILGNHTDYNQGFVLSCAVAQNTAFAMKRTEGTVCTLRDFRSGATMEFDLADLDDVPRNGSRYVKGMVKELAKRGYKVTAFDAAIESSVPLSAGMSSSAALETAAGYAIGKEFGIDLDKAEWARCGQGVENNYLGLKSGLLDQFSSIFGKRDSMILSDFRTVEVLRTAALPEGYSIVVINSMKKHNLVDSEYNVRRADCEAAAKVMNSIVPGATTLRDISLEQLADAKGKMSDREYRRALHVVGECTRVMEGVKLLDAGDVAGFGDLWFQSHYSSRDNFENSTPELDYLVELAQSVPGCLGARLSGGGFGGITIHLVASDAAEEYAKRVSAAYESKTGTAAECIICNIGDGAKLIEL